MGKYKRKYTEGRRFVSAGEAVDWLEQGGHVYWRGQFKHNGWARSWQVQYVISQVARGTLRKAHSNEEVLELPF